MRKILLFLFLSVTFIACNDDIDDNLFADNPGNSSFELFRMDEVPEITLEFSPAQWNAFLSNYDQNPQNETKVIAKFSYLVGGRLAVLDSIGVKMRGNTSRRRPEGSVGQPHDPVSPDWHHCHFGLDFDKFREGQNFEGRKKLNLKWFKDDANYVREIYSYDLFRRFNVWTAPKASYCRLTIKITGEENPAYFGVYAMVESVDEEFITTRVDGWGGNVGYMWKGGYAGSNVPDFVSTNSMGVESVSMNPAESQYFAYDLKTRKNELDAAKNQLTEFITDLNTKTGQEFYNWIGQKMDVDLFLRTYAVNVMVGMWDDYWVNTNNFYFHFASNGKAYFIPYDYDNTLGTSQILANSGTQDPLNWGPQDGRPLVTKILAIPEYRDKYKQFISDLADPSNDLFAANRSMPRIASWQTLISPYVSNDTGEDMFIEDKPASWGNAPFYRLSSGNEQGGANGNANYFSTRTATIPW